jgi:hypothetical protein
MASGCRTWRVEPHRYCVAGEVPAHTATVAPPGTGGGRGALCSQSLAEGNGLEQHFYSGWSDEMTGLIDRENAKFEARDVWHHPNCETLESLGGKHIDYYMYHRTKNTTSSCSAAAV